MKDNQEQVLLMDLVGIWTDLIKCYRIALNIRADKHLYGPLIICLVRACSDFFLRSIPPLATAK